MACRVATVGVRNTRLRTCRRLSIARVRTRDGWTSRRNFESCASAVGGTHRPLGRHPAKLRRLSQPRSDTGPLNLHRIHRPAQRLTGLSIAGGARHLGHLAGSRRAVGVPSRRDFVQHLTHRGGKHLGEIPPDDAMHRRETPSHLSARREPSAAELTSAGLALAELRPGKRIAAEHRLTE